LILAFNYKKPNVTKVGAQSTFQKMPCNARHNTWISNKRKTKNIVDGQHIPMNWYTLDRILALTEDRVRRRQLVHDAAKLLSEVG